MRILLTGASGYLGMHVLRALIDDGHHITAVVRTPARLGSFTAHPAVTVCQADLLDDQWLTAVRGQDVCVHAALIWGAPGTELELPDTRAAVRLFEAAGAAGVSRTVLVSSTAVHRPFRRAMHEDDALTTADFYGAIKAAAELFLWAACGKHDMGGVVLRSGPIVGPPAFSEAAFRSDRRISKFVADACAGQPLEVVWGTGRQFVAASDMARTIAAAVVAPEAEGVYLCVDREVTTWESIARQAVRLAGSESSVMVKKPATARPMPRFSDERLTQLRGALIDGRRSMEAHLIQLIARQRRGVPQGLN